MSAPADGGTCAAPRTKTVVASGSRHEPNATTGVIHLRSPFALEHGGSLSDCVIAWELHGGASLPLIVALGGISAGRHLAAHADDPDPGWWEPMVGRGRALDTCRYRVLAIDWLGGAGASTGPVGSAAFPAVSTRDQAAAIACVLDHLGVHRIHAFIGASYGGMVALAFAERWPDRTGRVIAIGAAHRAHSMATAVRAVQRRIVLLGTETGRTAEAIRLARGLAMTTYRTDREFDARFDNAPAFVADRARFPVEQYMDHHGDVFAARFPAESFLRLSESIDLHAVAPERIGVPTIVVGVRGDAIAPSWLARELVRRLGGPARHIEIDSMHGHDAFLTDIAVMSPVVREAVEEDIRITVEGGVA